MPTNAQPVSRCRVLFLRSHFVASSLIASGLRHAQVDFAQYPAYPPSYYRRFKKLDAPEEAWNDLHVNLISTPRELIEQLQPKAFDVILLSDRDGWLFEYAQASWGRKAHQYGQILRGLPTQGVAETRAQWTYLHALPFSVAELAQFAPVVMVDLADAGYIPAVNLSLIEHCALYFKRELPYDRFGLYQMHRPTPWSTRRLELLPLLQKKVRPIPLGITDTKCQALTRWRVPASEQDIDVFWAGQISNTMRATAITMLEELARTTPWKIVIANRPLPFEEFYQTVARSKLTISVAGGGWDCMRHYEALALGSLPLMNRPTIDAGWWHAMPEALYFENTFANFKSPIEQLLTNTPLRQQCAQEAEQIFCEHMVWSKIIGDILRETRM